MAEQRLQKILAGAGIASRRKAEELIQAGRVTVNDDVVTRLGSRADPDTDRVKVDGRIVRRPSHRTYLLLYKPRGYVSTLADPAGRPTVLDLLPRGCPRVFHVGRLDINTEGLLILTDDGDFAERVAHPRHGCEKVYLAKVSGVPAAETLERLRRGVIVDGVRTSVARIDLDRATRRDGNAWLTLVLSEGRSRQVRKMLLAVGHPVSKLRRVAIGPVTDRGMKPGDCVELTRAEIKALAGKGQAATAVERPAPARAAPRRRATGERR